MTILSTASLRKLSRMSNTAHPFWITWLRTFLQTSHTPRSSRRSSNICRTVVPRSLSVILLQWIQLLWMCVPTQAAPKIQRARSSLGSMCIFRNAYMMLSWKLARSQATRMWVQDTFSKHLYPLDYLSVYEFSVAFSPPS